MNQTKIEWTDMSWNPVTGCLHDCEYCYAKAISHRFKRSFEPEFHEKRIRQPLRENKSKKIFVCSMADLFGSWIPSEWIERVLKICRLSKQHTFQLLTKNPNRLLEFEIPDNCWVGCSATNQLMYDNASTVLSQLKKHVTFLSCEPLLERVELDWLPDWLIIGACSNPKPSQPDKSWVDEMINYAKTNNVPVFLKPNLKVVNHESYKEFPLSKCIVQATLY